jgi:hypothetical protein
LLLHSENSETSDASILRPRKTSESCHLLKGASALEEKNTPPGRLTPAIEEDYRSRLKQNEDHLSVPKEQIEEILKRHQ